METTRIQNGQTERLRTTALDSDGDFLTDLGTLSGTLYPTIEIRRKSDGYYLDFNDNTFKVSGWTTRQQDMSELDSVSSPGVYYYDFDTTGFADDEYFLRALNDTAFNFPFEGELKVGDFVDYIDASINDVLTDTNEIQGKLPTNNIMGSSVKTDKDDEIDDIKAKTDNLPTDPADQSAVELAISTSESNIRGTDNDDLKTISDQLDTAQTDLDNPTQYKADVSALATESNATTNTANIISAVDDNEAKIDIIDTNVDSIIANPNDYKANVSALATESNATSNKNDIITEVDANEVKIDSVITTLSTVVSDIWAYATRTLTSYGTLAGDVWSVVTRTLTGIGTSGISSEANATTNTTNIISEVDANETKIDTIDSNVDSIKLDIGNVTYGLSALQTLIDAIDTSTETTTRFDEIKGAGWTTETLKAIKDAIDAIVDNTDWTASEKEQIRDSLGIDGTKTTAENGQLQDVATEINATSNKDEVITQVNANETKIDTIDSNVDSIIANPDDYKADVSDLATSTEIASLEVLINRILGLSQENFRITVPVYNSNHLLTSATINTYNNAGDCDNNTNQLATYSVIATYNDSGEMQTYKVVKN